MAGSPAKGQSVIRVTPTHEGLIVSCICDECGRHILDRQMGMVKQRGAGTVMLHKITCDDERDASPWWELTRVLEALKP